jgi:hypothetical protein
MSVFDDNIDNEFPAQKLIRDRLVEYYESNGYQHLCMCNPNSEHLGLMTMHCYQVLFNIQTYLLETYGVCIVKINVEYLAPYKYKVTVICDIYELEHFEGGKFRIGDIIDDRLGDIIERNVEYVSVILSHEEPPVE